MPPIKFRLNQTFEEFQDGRHGGHLGYRNGMFSNSEFLRHCDASHKVSALLDLGFGRYRLKNFKMAAMAANLDIRMEQF